MSTRAATEYRYQKLTWPEINDAIDLGKVCIVPCGAVEQHGHHLPLDVDLVCPTGIADGAGRLAPDKMLVLPIIAYGYTGHVMDFYCERLGYNGFSVHDALAMIVALDKGFVGTKRAHVAVETKGELTSGMSVADLRPYARGHVGDPNADVALYVDPARFEQFLLERIADG